MHELLQERKAARQAIPQVEAMIGRLRANERRTAAFFESLAIQITRHAYDRHYLSTCDPSDFRLSINGSQIDYACAWQFPSFDRKGTLQDTYRIFGTKAEALFLESMDNDVREHRVRELVDSTFDRIGKSAFTQEAVKYLTRVGDWTQAVPWIVSSDASFDRPSGTSGGLPAEIQATQYFGQVAVTPLDQLHDELERLLYVLPSYNDAAQKLISTLAAIRERFEKTNRFNVNTALPGSILPLSVNDLLPLSSILVLFLYIRFAILWEEKRVSERSLEPELRYLAFPAYRIDFDGQGSRWSQSALLQRLIWNTWLLLPILVLYLSIAFRFNVVVPFELPYPERSLFGNMLAVRSYDPVSITIDYVGLFCLAVVFAVTVRLTSQSWGEHSGRVTVRHYLAYLVAFVILTLVARIALSSLTAEMIRTGDPRGAALTVFAALFGLLIAFTLIGYKRRSMFVFLVSVVSLVGLCAVVFR
jgi:hypothetical protein